MQSKIIAHRTTLALVAILVVGASGCKPATPEAPRADPAHPAPAAGASKVARHPCVLLTDAEIAAVVPSAQPGERDTGDEGYGIAACRWRVDAGAVMLQVFDAGPGALAQELRASSLEIVEIRRPDAAALVRLERFEGIGDMAGAYVERADSKRGIARSSAVLMVQSGGRLAVLRIAPLADGDRDQALKRLQALGVSLAERL